MNERTVGMIRSKDYDDLRRFMHYYKQIELVLQQMLGSVLEIGSGKGIVSRYLCEQGITTTSMDIDCEAKPDVVGSVLQIPFPNESFDLVLACEILEHIPYAQIPQAIKEIHRVTKGTAIISIPCATSGIELIWKMPFLGIKHLAIKIPLKKNQLSAGKEWELNRQHDKNFHELLRKHWNTTQITCQILDQQHPLITLTNKKNEVNTNESSRNH